MQLFGEIYGYITQHNSGNAMNSWSVFLVFLLQRLQKVWMRCQWQGRRGRSQAVGCQLSTDRSFFRGNKRKISKDTGYNEGSREMIVISCTLCRHFDVQEILSWSIVIILCVEHSWSTSHACNMVCVHDKYRINGKKLLKEEDVCSIIVEWDLNHSTIIPS